MHTFGTLWLFWWWMEMKIVFVTWVVRNWVNKKFNLKVKQNETCFFFDSTQEFYILQVSLELQYNIWIDFVVTGKFFNDVIGFFQNNWVSNKFLILWRISWYLQHLVTFTGNRFPLNSHFRSYEWLTIKDVSKKPQVSFLCWLKSLTKYIGKILSISCFHPIEAIKKCRSC